MKKLFAFAAALMMGVCAFASKDDVPTDAVLGDYYDAGQLCVCIYVPADMACYDVVFTGTYNGWASTVADCKKFEAVTGYDGWYVVAVDDSTASGSIEGKPVMLDADGAFNWSYQIGEATVIRGGVTAVKGSYLGEIDLKTYTTDAPNVYTVDAWKSNPCTAVYHNYVITVINGNGCDGLAVPYVVGGMNSWVNTEMTVNVDSTTKYGVGYYQYSFKAAEGTQYQLLCGLRNASTGEIETAPGWNDDSYLQVYVDSLGQFVRIPGVDGDNQLTGADANIVWDLRDATKYQWGRCAAKVEHDYTVTVKVPVCENAPASVELVGGWGADTWNTGVVMTPADNAGEYTATVTAYEGAAFKFRSQGSWDNEIQVYNEEKAAWGNADEQKFAAETAISLDFSDAAKYRWSACAEQTAIWNTNAVKVASKAIENGQLIITLENGVRYNVLGTLVK